jgi:hypothetical protein
MDLIGTDFNSASVLVSNSFALGGIAEFAVLIRVPLVR